MIQLIAFIIFLISAAGFILILARKIPVLVQLPQNGHHGLKKHETIAQIEKKIKSLYFDFFHKQVWLQKLLSKFRVWVLKVERKVDVLLHGMRKKAQELDKRKK